MARLSVAIITLNEEATLPALLDRVRPIADEIVVVDSGSTDRTEAIARAAGARFVTNPWPGFREQKSVAFSHCTGDYVLNLDADEVPSPELASALRAELDRPAGPRHAGYRIHFRHTCFGRRIRFGQMWHDRRVRVARRQGTRWAGDGTHPKLIPPGSIGDLPGRCDHAGFRDVADARAKLARYAGTVARERYRAGARFHAWQLLRWPAGFLRRYVLWLGLLDGWAGLQLALLYARYDLDKSLWLRRLHREVGGARGRGRAAASLRGAARRIVIALATALWPTPRGALAPAASIRKVLVVRPDERVGNQLLTTPLLRALKQGLPQAEIHLLAAARQAQVVSSPHVDRVIPFEKRLAFRAPWRFLGQLRALRRERYDVVVEAGHWSGFSLTSSLLARIASAGRPAIGHARCESARFLSHAVEHDPAHENEVRAKLELLQPFGIAPRDLAPETDLGADPAAAVRLLRACGVGEEPYTVLNPGARMADRRWSPAAYAEVARGLAARGARVLVVWGPREEAIAKAIADASGATLAPPTDLVELAALLRRARLCVSNNSGPMHLAVAVRTPTVGVFLSGERARWGHELSWFEAAEPRSDADAAAVLQACDRLLSRTSTPGATHPTLSANGRAS